MVELIAHLVHALRANVFALHENTSRMEKLMVNLENLTSVVSDIKADLATLLTADQALLDALAAAKADPADPQAQAKVDQAVADLQSVKSSIEGVTAADQAAVAPPPPPPPPAEPVPAPADQAPPVPAPPPADTPQPQG